MPLVSVVIPVYNAAAFLQETIDSVLCQTFRDFELILLDDESADNSVEIIRSYHDPRIRFFSCRHDFIGTVNRGYSEAEGRYIAQMDHDDLMISERLQIQYDYMENNPHIAACGGWMQCFGNKTDLMRMPLTHEQIVLRILPRGGPILNPTGFVRTQFIREHKIKHQSEYSYYADFKFWSEIAKRGNLANIPQILTLYRTSDEQTSVKYASICRDVERKVKFEMMEYLLSLIKDNHPTGQLTQKLMPVLEQLKEHITFSDRVFFMFMYELICGLKHHGVINL